MEPEKKDDGRKSRFSLKSLLVPAVAVIGVVCIRYVVPWWEYQKHISDEVKESGLSRDKIKQYHTLTQIPWGYMPIFTEKLDLKTLEVMVNDPEVIQIVGDNSVGSVVRSALYEWFVYKKDTGEIVQRRFDEEGRKAVREGKEIVFGGNFDPNEYLALRSQSKWGIFTMLAAKSYGLSTADLLRIPSELNVINYSLELKVHKIPPIYAVPLLQQGKTPEEIIKKYSMEVIGVSPKVREEYRAIKMPDRYGLTDKGIRLLAANGITPAHVEDMVKEVPNCIGIVFELVEQGKLNGGIYETWRPEVNVDDTLMGIRIGYTKEEAIKMTFGGESLLDVDQRLRSYLFNKHFINATDRNQPLSNALKYGSKN